MRITVESRIEQTPRALPTASFFDLEVGGFSKLTWDVELPLKECPWNIGLITGTSDCGKSTIARRLAPRRLAFVAHLISQATMR